MIELDIDYKRIGARIRSARKELSMTQSKLAESIGLSVNHISHIETGASPLSLPALLAICQVLGCTADRLLYDILPQSNPFYLNADIAKCFQNVDRVECYVMLSVANAAKEAIRFNSDRIEL
ncbi:MAG: helix-turn-helix domain-containing protein [Prevotella sp.]|jgi:transcriptional regulator with XRE-family HTH domain|nr:helix-turn-helix domain-containing protein [Prevotella sp.]